MISAIQILHGAFEDLPCTCLLVEGKGSILDASFLQYSYREEYPMAPYQPFRFRSHTSPAPFINIYCSTEPEAEVEAFSEFDSGKPGDIGGTLI